MNELQTIARKHAPTVPQVLKALAAMEHQLEAAKTYEAIRKVIKGAEALKMLLGEVAEVKQRAEWVVLVAHQRIDQEIKRIPKASGGNRRSKVPKREPLKTGRAGTGIPKVSRSRLAKLGALSNAELKRHATSLWSTGKDATVRAVVGELRQEEIKNQRKDYESRADRGAKVGDLIAMAEAGQTFNVIYADPPWEFRTYSERGEQRSPKRHYNVASLEEIKALPVAPLDEPGVHPRTRCSIGGRGRGQEGRVVS